MSKIIIPGDPEPKSENSLLSTDLFRRYAEQLLQRELDWHAYLRVAQLRESAGVKSKSDGIVQVRLPPRYGL